ncbi:hypothetical protein COO91_01963 [Nostoc flagelliforme CCNUN1]|uniref:Uncharacterized protein n=1 Tax=Nostoc flagelliforme CCNUN1 TaxID=2038116 RepID=A0A2K8SKS1_9NOSO|nr:hypothetical protein COO91_01963 [Nostoc flagelliforme CCNUN1]
MAKTYCRQRSPELLDRIFDSLPVEVNRQIMQGIAVAFQHDADILGWFCGYVAGEINCREDNQSRHQPITELSKTLIRAGMEPFTDFLPYPVCRLVILNPEKFGLLPDKVKAVLQKGFVVNERTSEQANQINDALLQEFVV